MTKYANGYVHHVSKNAKPEPGFRDYFEYRDLELGDATNGATFAQVITAKKAVEGGTGHHAHNVRFHWTLLEGCHCRWNVFERNPAFCP